MDVKKFVMEALNAGALDDDLTALTKAVESRVAKVHGKPAESAAVEVGKVYVMAQNVTPKKIRGRKVRVIDVDTNSAGAVRYYRVEQTEHFANSYDKWNRPFYVRPGQLNKI